LEGEEDKLCVIPKEELSPQGNWARHTRSVARRKNEGEKKGEKKRQITVLCLSEGRRMDAVEEVASEEITRGGNYRKGNRPRNDLAKSRTQAVGVIRVIPSQRPGIYSTKPKGRGRENITTKRKSAKLQGRAMTRG